MKKFSYKGNRKRGRCLALILVLTMLVGFVPNFIVKATDFVNIDEDNVVLTIGGVPFKDGMEVSDNDEVLFTMNWTIPNDSNKTSSDVFSKVIESKGISLLQAEDDILQEGNGVVGDFKFDNSQLQMKFTDDFLSKSQKIGKLSLQGVIDLSEIELDDSGNGTLQIMDKSYNISTDTSKLPIEASCKKYCDTSVPVTFDVEGNPIRTFKIEVTALVEGAKNIEVTDVTGEYLSIMPNSVTASGDISNIIYRDNGFECKVNGPLSKGQKVTISYQTKCDKNVYFNPDESKETNTAIIKDRFNKETEPEPSKFKIDKNWIKKSGTVKKEQGMTNWVVTVNSGDPIDIGNAKITDVMDEEHYEIIEGSKITVRDNRGATVDNSILVKDFIKNGYVLPADAKGKYSISYNLKIKDDVLTNIATTTTTNKAKIEFNTIAEEVTSIAKIPGMENPVKNKFGSFVDKYTIEWKVSVDVPSDVETGTSFKIRDQFYSKNMTLLEDSLRIVNVDNGTELNRIEEGSNEVGYILSKSTTEFGIAFNKTPGASYEITYRTQNGLKDLVFHNGAFAVYNNTFPAKACKLERTPAVSKDVVKTAKNGDVTWSFTFNDYKNDFSSGTNFTIKDKLPAGCEFIPESVKISASKANSLYSYNESVPFTQESDGITFDMTNVIKYALDNHWSGIYMEYQTKVTDINTIINLVPGHSLELKNEIEVDKDGTPFDISTNTAKVPASNTLKKTGQYSNGQRVYYTIEVNEAGFDLDENSGTLVVEDVLPETFTLVDGSILAINEAGENVLIGEPSYNDGVLTLSIPDGMHVTIKYVTRMNLEIGTELTEENSTNTVTLKGVDRPKMTTSDKLQGIVLKGLGDANNGDAQLDINKVDAETMVMLAGAKFSCKMVKYDCENGIYTDLPKGAVTGYKGEKSLVDNGDGTYYISNLLYDNIYKISEIEAPSGYKLNGVNYFYCVFTSDPSIEYPDGVEVFTEDWATVTIENHRRDFEETLKAEGQPSVSSSNDFTAGDNNIVLVTVDKVVNGVKTGDVNIIIWFFVLFAGICELILFTYVIKKY